MPLFQTILAILALTVGGVLLFIMLITFIADMRTRRIQARQAIAAEIREIATEKRARERHEQQLVMDAQMVELLRTVSEQGRESAKVSRALLGYIQIQGEEQKKHFDESIANWFRLHRGQAAIMDRIGEEHEKTRGAVKYGRRNSD